MTTRQQILTIMHQRRVTQAELARMLGTTQATVSRNLSQFHPNLLPRLCNMDNLEAMLQCLTTPTIAR